MIEFHINDDESINNKKIRLVLEQTGELVDLIAEDENGVRTYLIQFQPSGRVELYDGVDTDLGFDMIPGQPWIKVSKP